MNRLPTLCGQPDSVCTTRYAVPPEAVCSTSRIRAARRIWAGSCFCKKKKIGVAVPCGGHTSLDFPEKPEAGAAAEYPKPLVPDSIRRGLEEQPTNSTENARNVKSYIDLS